MRKRNTILVFLFEKIQCGSCICRKTCNIRFSDGSKSRLQTLDFCRFFCVLAYFSSHSGHSMPSGPQGDQEISEQHTRTHTTYKNDWILFWSLFLLLSIVLFCFSAVVLFLSSSFSFFFCIVIYCTHNELVSIDRDVFFPGVCGLLWGAGVSYI